MFQWLICIPVVSVVESKCNLCIILVLLFQFTCKFKQNVCFEINIIKMMELMLNFFHVLNSHLEKVWGHPIYNYLVQI